MKFLTFALCSQPFILQKEPMHWSGMAARGVNHARAAVFKDIEKSLCPRILKDKYAVSFKI